MTGAQTRLETRSHDKWTRKGACLGARVRVDREAASSCLHFHHTDLHLPDFDLATMASPLELYEPLDVIGNGSFGIIRKVRRKADGVVSWRHAQSTRNPRTPDLSTMVDLRTQGAQL